jgi:hypothetical protein
MAILSFDSRCVVKRVRSWDLFEFVRNESNVKTEQLEVKSMLHALFTSKQRKPAVESHML